MSNEQLPPEEGFDWSEFRMGVIVTIVVFLVLKILIEVVNP